MIEFKNNKSSVEDLSNESLFVVKAFLERTKGYFYHKEIRRLERIEKKAIIYDLEKFKEAKEKRYRLRRSNEDDWFNNWKVYKEIINELNKRNLLTKIGN